MTVLATRLAAVGVLLLLGGTPTGADPQKMRAPLQRVAQLLGEFIESSAPPPSSGPTQSAAPTRRDS